MKYRKQFNLLFLAALTLLGACAGKHSNLSNGINAKSVRQAGVLRVASFNIRNSAAQDGENSWENRKELVTQTIQQQNMMILGLQEALPNQVDYLANALPEYGWCGLPREDGKEQGEYAPVFYRKDRFRLLSDSTIWLSETPHIPGSISWNSACTRIATWAQLEDLKSGIRFYFVNTHFDHESELARIESAKLLLNLVQEKALESPVIITGDFNMVEKEEAYKTMVKHWKGFAPLYDVAKSAIELTGPDYTFQAFDDQSSQRCKIDFIFINNYCIVGKQSILPVRKGDLFVSDHYPVLAELRFALPSEMNSEDEAIMVQKTYPPYLTKGDLLFTDSTLIALECWNKGAEIRYTLDGSEPNEESEMLGRPIWLSNSSVLTAKAFKTGMESSRSVRIPFTKGYVAGTQGGFPVLMKQSGKSKRFDGGGSNGLLDGKRGSKSFQDGKWQGYEGNDLEILVDLGTEHQVNAIALGCLQSQRDWIFLPKEVQFLISSDGNNFKRLATRKINALTHDEEVLVKDISVECGAVDFRYLKVLAKSQGVCPQWHSGAGGKAWLFVDELILARD